MNRGRPRKLDDLTAKRILDAVRAGLPWALAAQAGGVSRSALMAWKARGADGEEPYSDFLDRLKKAEAEAVAESVNAIRAAGERQWQAHAWWLERRFPATFAARKHEPKAVGPGAGGFGGGTIDADIALAESVVAALKSAKGSGQ